MNASQIMLDSANKVVVGVDGSKPSQVAADWAADRAVRFNRTLLVVVAVPQVPLPSRTHAAKALAEGDYVAHVREHATATLAREAERLRVSHPAAQIQTQLVVGHAAEILAQASRDAMVVVVGARGHNVPIGVRALGGTADAVVSHSFGPVAVVTDRSQPHPDSPVLIGIDHSEQTPEVIRIGVNEATAAGVGLVALHVLDAAAWVYETPGVLGVDLESLVADEHKALAELMEPAVASAPGLKVDLQARIGNPPRELIEASKSALLMVIGSRGRGGFAGLLLGSTSREVVREAECPVIITHKRKESDS